MSVARIHKIYTPYNAVELSAVGYEQTNDVMYTVHVDKPVKRLSFLGYNDWPWTDVTFGPDIPPVVALNVTTAGSPSDPGYVATDYNYVVTGISDTLGQESRASNIVSAVNDLTLDNHENRVFWTPTSQYDRYVVYKEVNGVYGYIGGTEGNSLLDNNIIADLSNTPPKAQNPFAAAGDYPSTVTFHEQRLLFARTKNRPNLVAGSQTGDFENFDFSRPARDDDAFSQALVGRRVNAVNQLISSSSLLALTADSIYSVTGGQNDPIGPNAFLPKKQSGRGVSRLRAIEVDEVVFYQPAQGARVRALNYTFELDGYRSNDVSIFSPHLFKSDQIKAWAFQGEPHSCIWAVMMSGLMLCFTWQQEQQVWGWTVCETEGFFEDVVAITEDGADRIYVVVRREIDGVERRFYERMAVPHTEDITEACPVDCAVTQIYETPQAVVRGLDHLNGHAVVAYADGYVVEGLTVADGFVTLPEPATIVSVGLPFTCLLETLPLVLASSRGSMHTNRQTFGAATIRTIDTKGLEASVDGENWEPMAEREGDEPMGFLPTLGDKDYQIPLTAHWSNSATVQIRQTQPLPVHITGLFLEPIVAPR